MSHCLLTGRLFYVYSIAARRNTPFQSCQQHCSAVYIIIVHINKVKSNHMQCSNIVISTPHSSVSEYIVRYIQLHTDTNSCTGWRWPLNVPSSLCYITVKTVLGNLRKWSPLHGCRLNKSGSEPFLCRYDSLCQILMKGVDVVLMQHIALNWQP